MRRENNDNDEPLKNIFGTGPENSDPDFSGVEINFIPEDPIRPFNILWTEEKVKKFLIERGYKILSLRNPEPMYEEDEVVEVAVKPDQSTLPESYESNIMEVFEQEVEDILLAWLLKIGKDN